jgi:hypothetical protein
MIKSLFSFSACLISIFITTCAFAEQENRIGLLSGEIVDPDGDIEPQERFYFTDQETKLVFQILPQENIKEIRDSLSQPVQVLLDTAVPSPTPIPLNSKQFFFDNYERRTLVALSKFTSGVRADAASTPSPSPSPPLVEVHRIIPIIVSFKEIGSDVMDSYGSPLPPMKHLLSTVLKASSSLSSNESLEGTFDVLSRGTMKIIAHPKIQKSIKILGPYYIGEESCDHKAWYSNAIRQAFKSQDLVPTSFTKNDHVIILAPRAVTRWCGYSGRGTYPESPSIIWSSISDREGIPGFQLWHEEIVQILAHEYGHNLNLTHANQFNAETLTRSEYGDDSSYMGYTHVHTGLNVIHRRQLALERNPPSSHRIRQGGEYRLRIASLDSLYDKKPSQLPRYVQIELPERDEIFFISFRTHSYSQFFNDIFPARFVNHIALHSLNYSDRRTVPDILPNSFIEIPATNNATLLSISDVPTEAARALQHGYRSEDGKTLFGYTPLRTLTVTHIGGDNSSREVRISIPQLDPDQDGILESLDPDDDNDTVPDLTDCAPFDGSKWRNYAYVDYSNTQTYTPGMRLARTSCYGRRAPYGYLAP